MKKAVLEILFGLVCLLILVADHPHLLVPVLLSFLGASLIGIGFGLYHRFNS